MIGHIVAWLMVALCTLLAIYVCAVSDDWALRGFAIAFVVMAWAVKLVPTNKDWDEPLK